MNRRFSLVMLAMISSALVFSGCSMKNDASKAAAESEETEKEGNGETGEAAEESEEAALEEQEEPVPEKIYILMPGSRSDSRWRTDMSVIRSALREKGYQVVAGFAGDDPETQAGQIEDALREETVALIVAPSDPYSLGEVLEKADEAGIKIFDYNELIMDTASIDFFISFDMREAGHMVADRIIKDTGLDKLGENDESLKIEMRAGNLDRVSGLFLYNGVKEQLQEYYDKGVLADAGEDDQPDILCLTDGNLISSALEEYSDVQDMYVAAVDTGVDTIRKVADGAIDAVLFMDNRDLAETCAGTVITRLSGEDPEVSNYEEFDNGVKLIKTAACDPQIIDQTNYAVLIDDGFFAPGTITVPAAASDEAAQEEETTEKTEENEKQGS